VERVEEGRSKSLALESPTCPLVSFLGFNTEAWEQALTDIVADLDWSAAILVAGPKDAKVDAFPATQGDNTDDGRR
jgi:hypothetical protein